MQGTTNWAEQGEIVGLLVGGACGSIIAVGVAIAMVFYFKQKRSVTVPQAFAPCPQCGERSAKAVAYTWWGGLLGPKLLSHVECAACQTTFNGKTGRSNTLGIVIYLVVTFTVVFGLLGVAAIAMYS